MPRTKMDDLVEKLETEEVVEETPKAKKAVKKKFDQSDGVMCHSVLQGGYYLEGQKTKMLYEFSCYGDTVEIEYRDLVAEIRTRSKSVFQPRLIVDDKDFVEEFPQLKKFYSESYTTKELRDILKLSPKQMIEEIKQLPSGALDTLKSMAATFVKNGTIDSVKTIKALDEYFGTDLNLLADLVQD